MNLLYKYYSLDKLFNNKSYSIQDLIDGNVSFVSLISFNDPFEGYGRYSNKNYFENESNFIHDTIAESYAMDCRELRDKLALYNRIFCVTESYKNPLMWSHYADSHRGCCVGFSQEDIEAISTTFDRVNYQSTPFDINGDKSKCLYIKSPVWEYEKEWRAVYHLKEDDIAHLTIEQYNNNNNKARTCESCDYFYYHQSIMRDGQPEFEILKTKQYFIKECKPREIYLGLKIPLGYEQHIKKLCYKEDIKIYKMSQAYNAFDLIPKSI